MSKYLYVSKTTDENQNVKVTYELSGDLPTLTYLVFQFETSRAPASNNHAANATIFWNADNFMGKGCYVSRLNIVSTYYNEISFILKGITHGLPKSHDPVTNGDSFFHRFDSPIGDKIWYKVNQEYDVWQDFSLTFPIAEGEINIYRINAKMSVTKPVITDYSHCPANTEMLNAFNLNLAHYA